MSIQVIPWAYPPIPGQASNQPETPGEQVDYLDLSNVEITAGWGGASSGGYGGNVTVNGVTANDVNGVSVIYRCEFTEQRFDGGETLPDFVRSVPVSGNFDKNIHGNAGPGKGAFHFHYAVTIKVVNAVGQVLQQQTFEGDYA